MAGMGGTIIEATAQLTPIYIGLIAALIASALGILAATPVSRTIRQQFAVWRKRTFSGKRRPSPAHFPMQA